MSIIYPSVGWDNLILDIWGKYSAFESGGFENQWLLNSFENMDVFPRKFKYSYTQKFGQRVGLARAKQTMAELS